MLFVPFLLFFCLSCIVSFGINTSLKPIKLNTYIISFEEMQLDFNINPENPKEKRNLVSALLRQKYQQKQADLLSLLDKIQVNITNHLYFERYVSLWISNCVILYGATEPLVHVIQQHPDVKDVEIDETFYQNLNVEKSNLPIDPDSTLERPQGNIKALKAEYMWQLGYHGEGVVVANIDSGVRYSHDALFQNYRGYTQRNLAGDVNHDYSFWVTDNRIKLTPDNADPVGHGTHTMGTAVGSHGIGMAPKSTWITARPFQWDGSSKKSNILLAAQWVMCPAKWDGANPNCSLGADIVSNSFGTSNKSMAWMNKIIKVWSLSGIIPVFASGNVNGFKCGSVMCPGCEEEAIAVGALVSKSLWGGSGKGPGENNVIKPDFVAPGVAIRSALSTGDLKYTRLTGTSMATPHVVGAFAIILKVKRTLRSGGNSNIVKILQKTTTRNLKKPFLVPSKCGNTTYRTYPNNIYGWGLPDVCKAAVEIGINCVQIIKFVNKFRGQNILQIN